MTTKRPESPQLQGSPASPPPDYKGNFGLDEPNGHVHEHDLLGSAKPFDRAFIDMMIPHHQGAVRMAHAELAKAKNPQLRTLAQRTVKAQDREIREMNQWRAQWYGAVSPSGGIPQS